MKIESLPNEIKETIASNSGFRQYLNSLNVGRPKTPRSWLFEGKSDTEVLSMWMKQLDLLKSKTPYGEMVYQFDTSQLKKWGPQGEVKPIKELMDVVTEGFTKASSPMPSIFKSAEWQQAKERTIDRLFKKTGLYHRLRPRAPESVVDDMSARDTLSSNSGYPDFGRRKIPEILNHAYKAVSDGTYKQYPAVALFRNYNQKTRLVWMYPLSTNIAEGRFVQPLKELMMKSNIGFFAPWRGYDFVLAQLSLAYETGGFLSASDFSHTDAHFTKWQVLEVYDVIKHAFAPQFWDELKDNMLHVCQIPLLIGPDQWIVGDHGVSSGSNWTNDVETYMDLICEEFFTIRRLVSQPLNAIGDDVIHFRDAKLGYKASLSDELAEIYQSMGFDVNADKVTNELDRVKYLQRLTIRGYNSDRSYWIKDVPHKVLRGIYSTVRALNSSLNPEKFHSPKLWNKDMFAVRQFMILENCIDHPLFNRFVKFVCSGHLYLCEFARKSDDEINEAQAKSRILPGLNPTYNQEKRDKPLSSFASINIARNL